MNVLKMKKMGTMVSGSTMEKLIEDNHSEYPILGRGTTVQDFNESRYVMSTVPVTTLDLERYCMFENGHVLDKYADEESEWEDETPLLSLGEFAVISQVVAGLKKELQLSMQDGQESLDNVEL